MDSKKSNSMIDPFSIVGEILYFIIEGIVKLLKVISIWSFRKVTGRAGEQQKIERKELKVKKKTTDNECLGIDTKSKKKIKLEGLDFSKHSFIVGATGFGKTNLISILHEDYLKRDVPIIFFDPKGDLQTMLDFKKLCESYGKLCHIFSESYADSISLNPLGEGTVYLVQFK